MNALEITGVSRRFGRVTALDGISFSVPEGGICALLGPNGAGKTTLLEIVMNLVEPSSGLVSVLGRDSKQLGPGDLARIGYVSENQKVSGTLRLGEFISFVRGLYPTWDSALESRLMRDFELPLSRKVKELSRGMRVRMLFVAALSFRPKLLVLDEPFSGLDPLMRDDLVGLVLELAAENGTTIVLSSHDIDEVARVADSVACLDKGRLSLAGNIESLRGRHRKVLARVGRNWNAMPLNRSAWLGLEREGDFVTFVDSEANARDLAQVREVFGADAVVSEEPLGFKEIYLAHARAARAEGRNKE